MRPRACLVLGSASCLWDDVEVALSLGEYDAVYAAKQAGIVWPGQLDCWVTLHPEWALKYKKERHHLGHPPAKEIVAHHEHPHVTRVVGDFKWPGMKRSGASGMLAVRVAELDGHNRIVLAGVPMDNSDRIDGRRGWKSHKTYQESMAPVVSGLLHVRSVSGWTREMLGAPTAEWLRGEG